MNLIVYDVEVFAYDWLVVFKDKASGQYIVIHNDNEALKGCLDDYTIYCGFNSKHYDQFIIKAIWLGCTPQEIKALNDYLIGGGQGWEYPLMRDNYFSFNNIDIRDDVQIGLSLKAIEGHMNMSVQESNVAFDLDRPLTEEELQETIFYCKHDVDATEKLIDLRKDYLKTKLNLGKRAGIGEVKSLAATNAKLTAMMLRAQRREWNDGRDYVYPENLDTAVIPKPILDFFDTIHDLSIPDDVLFKTSFEYEIGGMPCKYAWGGVHGSLTAYYEEATESRVIQNRDVSSLYPSLIEQYHYLSRNVPDPELFYAIRRDRIRAKHEGDKQTATDLKLPLNTVSGAQENRYNDLYDPLPTRSLRISGQLFLTVLTVRLLTACKTIKLLNLNTDGLMYSIDKEEVPLVDKIAHEWEVETRFELEVDEIERVWIKDVNNLLIVKKGGSVKKVGGYLNYGVSVKGAWAINNNMIVVKKALVEFFVHGTPVEETVNGDTDIFDFQLIAKAGAKYREAYHLVDGVKQPVQRVNRVYATKDQRYGRLFKVKAENDSTAKIEMLPEHCVIDNENQLSIEDIDKQWYIDLARKRINDFLGVAPKNKRRKKDMATTTAKATEGTARKTGSSQKKMTVYQKLAAIRREFPTMGVQKSGLNTHAEFQYYELSDIVPAATELFNKYNCMFLVSFLNDSAMGTFRDMDEQDEDKNEITFIFPIKSIAEPGKFRMNEIQALGAEMTYMRRYLYYLLLDICNADEFDNQSGDNPPVQAPKAPPATPAQREEVKKTLTNPEGNATDLQIRQLKNALKKLKEAHPEKEEMIAEIAVKTNGFTEISKTECENIVAGVSTLLEKQESAATTPEYDEDNLPF